jgi:hypothetical protein
MRRTDGVGHRLVHRDGDRVLLFGSRDAEVRNAVAGFD